MSNQTERVPQSLFWTCGIVATFFIAMIGWHEIRLGRIEAGQATIKGDVREVKTDVKWIRETLDRSLPRSK